MAEVAADEAHAKPTAVADARHDDADDPRCPTITKVFSGVVALSDVSVDIHPRRGSRDPRRERRRQVDADEHHLGRAAARTAA